MTSTDAKTTKRRRHRSQSEIAVDSIVRMPLGDLCRVAQVLVSRDIETARFLLVKISEALDAIDPKKEE